MSGQPITMPLELASQVPPGYNSDDLNVAFHKNVCAVMVQDSQGRAVMVVEETTGVVVDGEYGQAMAVQQDVHGVVINDGRPYQYGQQQYAITAPQQQVIQTPYYDDDDDDDEESCCSCLCFFKWLLISIFCFPCLPFIICYVICCRD